MHFHENHATTLSEHHIFKEKGITENKVDYVYVRFVGNLKSIKHEQSLMKKSFDLDDLLK